MEPQPVSQIAAPQPVSVVRSTGPPAIIEWGVVIAAIISGVAYFGQWYLKQTAKKEDTESEINKQLISHLLTNQAQLLEDNRQGIQIILDHIDLKAQVSKMSALLKDDVQRALTSQADMYRQGLENQTRMEGKLDVCLRQNDQIIEMVKQPGEKT